MSTLWTPSGEHRPAEDGPDAPQGPGAGVPQGPGAGVPQGPGARVPQGPGAGAPQGPGAEVQEPSPEEVAALAEVHARLVATPVEDVVANHALGIWQLALVHLGVITPPDADGRPPEPNLVGAGLAIDALAALVDGLGERLGVHEAVLRDALTQAQMLFVEISDSGPEPSA